jgi:hypothetical protein
LEEIEMEMARLDDQDCTTSVAPNLAYPQIFPLTTRPAQSRCRPSRKKSGTEPTLDEMLREPAIHLIMRRDNVPEDQLLHFIKLACRHIKGE